MEVKTWFFNADFEKSLFESPFEPFQSLALNQEFEYLINYLHPDDQIYTLKNYDDEFSYRFEKITGKSFKTTQDKKNVQAWGQNYNVDVRVKELQSKTILLKFKDLGLIQHEVQLIDHPRELEEGYIYKFPYSFSGLGHYQYPQDKTKCESALKNHLLIKEKKLNRVSDFSTLIENNQVLCCYENFVDRRFQYKGTRITPENPVKSQHELYQKMLKEVFQLIRFYPGVCSLDSFYYLEDEQVKLQPISEINMRKSMGYFTYRFKEKYFPNEQYVHFLLSTKKLKTENSSQVFSLSPENNKFQAYFLVGSNSDQLDELAQHY